MRFKYLIIGAGPAGLTLACALKRKGIDSFLLLEKETEAGGLCRSEYVDGAYIDVGGGHFLDTKRENVTEFLFQYMPREEWNIFQRKSTIDVNGCEISHPFEANLWQFPKELQNKYLESIKVAGCNTGEKAPELFVDWIRWKLGDQIANDYMLPYNQKMFGDNLNELGTYWVSKLPSVSYEETLQSCIDKKAYGKEPGHTFFYYPKDYGYGELWKRMAESLSENIEYNTSVKEIDVINKCVLTNDNTRIDADYIINTAPWTSFDSIVGLPDSLKSKLSKLRYSSVEIAYYPQNVDSDAHWIYYPDKSLGFHRRLLRHNFIENAKGHWIETNLDRVNLNGNAESNYKFINKYAYPLNTIDKPQIIDNLLSNMEKNGVFGLGRWGEWQHYNSDVVVDLAMKMSDRIAN